MTDEEAIGEVFTGEVLGRWRKQQGPTDRLRFRLAALSLDESDPSSHPFAPRLRAERSAWGAYIRAAFACGLFGGESGADLRARLSNPDDGSFRSAMAECMTCWLLSEKLGLEIEPRPAGRGNRVLDLRIVLPDGSIHVEVKSPSAESGSFFTEEDEKRGWGCPGER